MNLSAQNHWLFSGRTGIHVLRSGLLVWGFCVAGVFSGTYAQSAAAPQMSVGDIDKLEKLYQIRSQQIPLLEDFIKKYPNTPKRPDTFFRLGEALFETAKYHDLKGDRSGSEARQMKAVQYLEQLRTEHPTYRHLDKALFVLANAYMERKMITQAGSVLADLAERYPDSPIIEQASLLLGDHYFAEKQFARAESYYLKAASDEKIGSFVKYKLGWVAINQDQPAKALKYFEQVLSQRGGPNDYSRDAAREMIWPALQVYGSAKVADYLERTLKEPELVESSLTSLAEGLQQRDEHAAASQLYESLRQKFASSAQQNQWLMSQIKSEENLGRTSKVQSLVMQVAQTADGSNNPQAMALLMTNAKKFHAEAQKTKDQALKIQHYEMAIVYYKSYADKLDPSDPKFTETQFYLGEALYARERLSEAAVAYEIAAKSPSGIQSQAAWNWLLTAEKLAEGFKYKGTDFHATTTADEKYLEAARFVQNLSSISLAQKRRASYLAARLVYQLNDFERALPAFQALADQHGESQEGKLASQLVLDIYNLRKDYKKVAELARQYKSKANDSSSRAELTGLEQKASLKSLQEEEATAKSLQGSERLEALNQVAKKYLNYVKTYPTAQQVDGAAWAAFSNFTEVAAERKQSDRSEMREAFKVLTTEYSRSKHSAEAIRLMGKFMSIRRPDDTEIRDYRQYRDEWAALYREEAREERGRFGMLIYRLSNDSQRRALEQEFLKLPMNDSNREAIAYGRLTKVREMHAKVVDLKLNSLKTLQKNTAKKVNLLDQLQSDVTDLANLKVGETTVAGLQILADANLNMASSLRQAPIPSQLQGENLSRYQAVVAEKAGLFESKGREAEKLARDTASQLNLSGT